MDPREKLKAIQEQKSKLKARIDEINGQESKEMVEDKELAALLQKKQMVEEERRKQAEYQKLEKEYNERRKQMEREKELARLQNERRVLELQAAMKRVVVEGIKQKVKGMNSDQLMMRGFLRDGEEIPGAVTNGQKSNANFKEAFEGFLLEQGADKLKAKYDIKQLNEQRLAYFQRKEETVMRGILLKELAASQDPTELDVMALNRQALEEELEKRGIDFEDYMHPVDKQLIVENYPVIEQAVKGRIGEKRREQEAEVESALAAQRERRALREHVKGLSFKSVQVVQRLLYDLFDQICNDYQKRHVPLSEDDKALRARNLQQQYQQICRQGLVQQLSRQVAEDMLQSMRLQMLRQAAEQVYKLHDMAHMKTELCFKGLFGDNASERITDLDRFKFPLVFVSEAQNVVGKPKQEKYMKNLDNENGIYETQESTTNLVNDIVLLDAEEKYLDKVTTQIKKQIDVKTEDTVFCYDRQLFAVTRNGIRSVVGGLVYYSFVPVLQGLIGATKLHKNWLLQSQSQLIFVSSWGREEFGSQLGSRISNPCGTIICASFYPVVTMLGTPCSAIVGFQKGQILKFNFNCDRVSGRQTNLTHYLPVIQHAKSGDQPAFPLDNRNYLPIELDKPKPTQEIHQYRQFLQHHSEPVIFVGFYRIDKLISVDRGLKCALWQYGKGRGSYQPIFKFQIKSSYHIFTQDENPRYKDIYPTNSSNQTPQEMYQKYMQTQAFLRLQLYNNPKKEIAYFKSPLWQSSQDQKPIWKITYKQSRGQVNKILQSFYNVTQGGVVGQQAQLIGDTLYVLCQREHIIRNDLKTVKIYSWNISQKRLGRVGVQIDMFKDQKVSSFIVLPAQFRGADLDMVLVVNSGRMLLFSLVSGQLLKNINEQINTGGKEAALYFKGIVRANDKDIIYGISSTGVVELGWDDGNSVNQRNRLNKAIDAAKRKYFR